MKTLIVSDTHITNHFDQAKFDYLAELIKDVDQIILNGDFWDGYLTTWDEVYNSEWQRLFELLREKETIYIYGNHDKKEFSDDRIKEFTKQQLDRFEMKAGKYMLHIEHGNHITPSPEATHDSLDNKPMVTLGSTTEHLFFKILGKLFLRFMYSNWNKKMREHAKSILPPEYVLVTGHTHLQENSIKDKYINTGWFRYGYAQYLLVEDDNFDLVDSKY